ncbi:hypothetical protein Tco_1067746 [Tanacetum coccineum]|uniref:Uncharacterized protein n=1 Tax=Tanacetum coccineum TaxID=301880 RepID=A0ABQ5HEM2_9ASTR
MLMVFQRCGEWKDGGERESLASATSQAHTDHGFRTMAVMTAKGLDNAEIIRILAGKLITVAAMADASSLSIVGLSEPHFLHVVVTTVDWSPQRRAKPRVGIYTSADHISTDGFQYPPSYTYSSESWNKYEGLHMFASEGFAQTSIFSEASQQPLEVDWASHIQTSIPQSHMTCDNGVQHNAIVKGLLQKSDECDNHDLSRFDNQSIERDRLIGIGFVLDFVEFISFTFSDKEMILVIEAVSR